jgi:hypothetical protein
MSNEFTLIKNKKSKKYIPLFFAFIFLFFYIFLNNIKINDTLCYFGYIKSNQKQEYIYTDNSGVIIDVFVKNNQKISPNEKIYSIKKNDPFLIEKEDHIAYLENLLVLENDNKSKEYLKNKIQKLKEIHNNVVNYYYEGSKPKYINAIYISKNKEVFENKKALELKNKEEGFYLESFIPKIIYKSALVNDAVILTFENNNTKYTGLIESINKNVFTTKEIKNYSGFDFPKNAYKIKVRMLTFPNSMREGHKVNFKIMKEKKSLLHFIIENIKKAYYDF